MTRNMGTADRLIRLVLAVALLAVGLGVVGGAIGTVLAAVGVVFLATSATGFCPLYAPFGISTCPTRPSTTR